MKNEQIVLSIETGVRGGSLSLSRNGEEIDCRNGDDSISRAEDVLEAIAKLLKDNNIVKTELGLIKISSGPGSPTGLRIGRAIALGLARAAGATVKAVPLLEAMKQFGGRRQDLLTAVPSGKNQIFWRFDNSKEAQNRTAEQINLTSAENFLDELSVRKNVLLIIPEYLYVIMEKEFSRLSSATIKIKTVSNLAKMIGESIEHMSMVNASDNEARFINRKNVSN